MSYRAAPAASIAMWEQRKRDAARARELVEAALDFHSELYRTHGADRLLRAAQVHATLAASA